MENSLKIPKGNENQKTEEERTTYFELKKSEHQRTKNWRTQNPNIQDYTIIYT